MDQSGLGLLYLCFSWTGIPTIAGIIEGIIYLTKSDEEFQARYG
jgi:TM2 domain-containing membrane protein YozV